MASLLVVVVVFLLLLFTSKHCPSEGLAFSSESSELHRLKNRRAPPLPSDFDERATLLNLVQPGDDENRWSSSRAARLEGYVVSVAAGPVELTNCASLIRRDTHIHIGLRENAPPAEQVVVEVTPGIETWAKHQGLDWSEESLRKQLTGHWVRFEGWLLFDMGHAGESENINPGRRGNWRATAWELHPVTQIELLR